MVRAAGTNPHVQQDRAAVDIHVLGQRAVFLGAEPEAIKVRSPDQPLYLDTPLHRRAKHSRDFRTGTVEQLIGITAPVSEQQAVTTAHGVDPRT